jgi:hypothetical protein
MCRFTIDSTYAETVSAEELITIRCISKIYFSGCSAFTRHALIEFRSYLDTSDNKQSGYFIFGRKFVVSGAGRCLPSLLQFLMTDP